MLHFRNRKFSKVFVIALVLSLSYSITVSYADFVVMNRLITLHYEVGTDISKRLVDDNAIFYASKLEIARLAVVKTNVKTRLIGTWIDFGMTTERLMVHYHNLGKPLYIWTNTGGNINTGDWINATQQISEKRNLTNVQYINVYTAKVIEK
jgi:hypothetical protein